MTAPYYSDSSVTVYAGDCLDVMRGLPDCSVDAVVTDPPYGLGFMGKEWDSIGDTGRGSRVRRERAAELTPTGEGHSTSAGPYLAAGIDSLRSAGKPFQAWCELWAAECLRLLKPGGYLVAFGGTRTYHRLACAVEDAGFEVRDSIAWLYGSGFPKSLDVSKAIDKAAGAEREPSGAPTSLACEFVKRGSRCEGHAGETATSQSGLTVHALPTAPATDAAREWDGWGTALKPAHEPIVVARKPLVGTVAANVLTHGTGALNIAACRVATGDALVRPAVMRDDNEVYGRGLGAGVQDEPAGRWPTNVLLDQSQSDALDAQTGVTVSRIGKPRGAEAGEGWGMTATGAEYADAGGASRFFPTFRYEAKAPTDERPSVDGVLHPTVKPLDLMRWLVRLVTPRGGIVLEPFLGSGTTAEACVLENLHCIGIEREAAYLPLTVARLSKPLQVGFDFGETA